MMDEEGKIDVFQEITSLHNREFSRSILRQNSWNVDLAVNTYIAGNEPYSRISQGNNVERHRGNNELENESWIKALLWDPVKWVFHVRQMLINPEADTRKFIKDFNQKYGFQHPVLQTTSYQNAVQTAFRQHKQLLVYIHSPLHEDTKQFCENTLCNQNVSRYVDDNALLWAGCVWDTEAYSLSVQLKANTFPFIAVLVCESPTAVQVIDRIEGTLEDAPLLERLTQSINVSSQFLNRIRADVQRREAATHLRAQQDDEYREAEEKDRRDRLRREHEAEEALRRELEAQQEEELREAQEMSRKLSQEALVRSKRDSVSSEAADGPDTCTIRFQLPKSSKFTRRFNRSDSVRALHDFLLVHFHDSGSEVYNFSISTHSKVHLNDHSLTLEAVGLQRRDMLYVTDLDS